MPQLKWPTVLLAKQLSHLEQFFFFSPVAFNADSVCGMMQCETLRWWRICCIFSIVLCLALLPVPLSKIYCLPQAPGDKESRDVLSNLTFSALEAADHCGIHPWNVQLWLLESVLIHSEERSCKIFTPHRMFLEGRNSRCLMCQIAMATRGRVETLSTCGATEQLRSFVP